jgi:hypothetical protein
MFCQHVNFKLKLVLTREALLMVVILTYIPHK